MSHVWFRWQKSPHPTPPTPTPNREFFLKVDLCISWNLIQMVHTCSFMHTIHIGVSVPTCTLHTPFKESQVTLFSNVEFTSCSCFVVEWHQPDSIPDAFIQSPARYKITNTAIRFFKWGIFLEPEVFRLMPLICKSPNPADAISIFMLFKLSAILTA